MENIFHLAICWIHAHFTFNLPPCKSTNWMKTRMLQKPPVINAAYGHILLSLYALARSAPSKIPSAQKISQTLLVGVLFPVQAVEELKNYPWERRMTIQDGSELPLRCI